MHESFHIEEEYGRNLPEFESEFEAIAFYFDFRIEKLSILNEAAEYMRLRELDYSPESLIDLEKLYFMCFRTNGWKDLQLTIHEFETMMSIYFGEVVTRNIPGTDWAVQPYPFNESKYVLGLNRGKHTDFFTNYFEDHYLSVKSEDEHYLLGRFKRIEKRMKR
ncbi:hypothetical protein J9317_19060 [Metabacillus sp. KIGAM252]|uniref:Uncharacterized protein n=1 Tax=Metabacillus flavus TaxID=2823519 RepID=A0ABS5LJC3_9BACI|nr:hypothetical protein [Metabacillus flavus]MBS2970845.1 hypothetical protein [Metabacillus flavus]